MATDSSLLDSGSEFQPQEELYKQLLLQTTGGKTKSENPDSTVIQPCPGMCVKTRSQPDNQKIFINICQSTSIPPPLELSREELVELLKSEDTNYRFPMSLGEPHADIDNSSLGCTAYDVVVNQDFFVKCQEDSLFLHFLILVSVEALEKKYNLELGRDWKVLKNRKSFGSVGEQYIRTKSRPIIEELPPQDAPPVQARRPEFSLLVEPPVDKPEYLIAEIQLPGVSSCTCLLLDVGEDRLVLSARPSLFHLDVFHPLLVDQENSLAQYNTHTQILTVTMPVVSS